MMTNGLQQRLLFILTLVLFIRGHQGFFIKHSSSGLCLQSAPQYRAIGGTSWGPLYLVHFYNTCLHRDAQFRFFQPYSVLYNIGKDGTFLARFKKPDYKEIFHIYHSPIPPAKDVFIYTQQFTLSQTEKGSLKLYNGLCPTPVKPGTNPKRPFIPQNGDEVYQTTSCDKEDQTFIFGQVTKEGKNMTDVGCSPSQVMEVVMAEYGGFSDGKIFDYTNDANCSLPSANIVKSQCDAKISCNMNVDSSLFRNDPGKEKQLYMEYVCVDSLTTPITKARKVRLSELPNEGFIEIFDGSKWRKVDDKNWDKRKQTPLCQHLGYSDTMSNNNLQEISSGEIATGYLYCSGQQPSTQACSAYLYPSTLTNKATKIPYGKCTLCDEPLLQNSTKFPDIIFSTSDSNGPQARLSNSGWCPKNSGTQYLQIDLQKDFFISHIATFGDKEQTKWATSYDLQYSRISAKLGSSTETKINANGDAYGVSITVLNIVYVRFLKITVQNGDAVCIRVQLCGHVLVPDAVKQLTVSGKTAITADISWTLPEYEGHGGTTYFLISLNDSNPSTNVTRQSDNQHQLKNLRPYTNYKATVQAGNAYGLGGITSEIFRTEEAAPSGPPLGVVIYSKSKSSLSISWKPPNITFWNGIVNMYKVCHSITGDQNVKCSGAVTSSLSYTIRNLQSATKYSVKVSAGTSAGYGTVFSAPVIDITNQGPIMPTKNTSFSLSLSLNKPQSDIKSILIIVQATTSSMNISDTYQPNQLKPFSAGSSDPYVTAGFSYDNLPKTFVVGDGGTYKLDNTNYINQPLKANTPYILFVRFIETEKLYYSTMWSGSVKTYEIPAAPKSLKTISLSYNSLNISWETPKLRNMEVLKSFNICYKEYPKGKSNCRKSEAGSSSFKIDLLKSATMHEISVRLQTTIGESVSEKITKITNDKPPEISERTLSGFHIKLPYSTQSVKTVYIIVKNGRNSQKLPDEYLSNDLKPYDAANPSHPYITTVVENFKDFSQMFEVGSGMWKNLSSFKYYNKQLEQNKTYIVFARLFINSTNYYSTDWTIPIIIIPRPPAPENIKIVSVGKDGLNISWEQWNLPRNQSVTKHIVTYKTGEKTETKEGSKEKFYILNGLQYDTKYVIWVQAVTDNAGSSDLSENKTETTNSEPLPRPEKGENGYTVSLRKPKEGVTKVYLVVLQLRSNTTKPFPAEDLKPETLPSNNAVIAGSYEVSAFEDNSFDVVLGVIKKKRRRRRDALDILQPNMTARFSQLNYHDLQNGYSASYWSDPIDIPARGKDEITSGRSDDDAGDPGVVIGVTISLVIILVLVIVGAIFWRRRRSNENHDRKIVYDKAEDQVSSFANGLDNNDGEAQNGDRHDEDIYSNETVVTSKQAHPPVPISEFAHYVNEMKEKDNGEFNKEFEGLPTTPEASWDVSKKPDNKKRNRYGNIVTYDHSRVILSGDEDNDYINASFIDGIKSNSYIACQGPTKVTLSDMWRMVWEQNSYTIVMVTSLKELGKPKCEQYWPDKGSEMYDDIQVTLTKTEKFAYFITHSLQIKKDGEEREVKHYYFSSWPDHGVPKYPTPLLAFRKHIRANHFEQSGPIIVHCSAGVGRTGVFLAIDMSLQKLEKGTTDTVDVYGQVVEMRGRRMNMIQTLEQYIFVHDAILETILCGMNEVNSSNIKQEIKKLSEVQAGGMTGFQEKFKRLGEISPTFSDEECSAGLLEGNETRNRSKSIYPAECNRVGLQYIYGVEDSDYINAVFVHGFLGKNYFIATQSPLPNTVDDFWRLVHEQKSSVIVLLNNVKDGTSFPKFWPSARAEPKQYGSVTVQLESATEKEGIVTRKFLFSPYPDLHDAHVVKIFHYTKWQDHQTPETADGVIKLMSLVEKTRQSSGEAPVIVACSNGAGRTGTYIAISNLLERMKLEQTVDVFQSIKIIRSSRPQFVENAVQFKFCYEVVSSYLDSFGEYANFEC